MWAHGRVIRNLRDIVAHTTQYHATAAVATTAADATTETQPTEGASGQRLAATTTASAAAAATPRATICMCVCVCVSVRSGAHLIRSMQSELSPNVL